MEPTEDQKLAFATALLEALEANGLTVPQLAKQAGTSHQKLYQWIALKGSPRAGDDLEKIENVLSTRGDLAAVLTGGDLRARISRLESQMAEVLRLVRRLPGSTQGGPEGGR